MAFIKLQLVCITLFILTSLGFCYFTLRIYLFIEIKWHSYFAESDSGIQFFLQWWSILQAPWQPTSKILLLEERSLPLASSPPPPSAFAAQHFTGYLSWRREGKAMAVLDWHQKKTGCVQGRGCVQKAGWGQRDRSFQYTWPSHETHYMPGIVP